MRGDEGRGDVKKYGRIEEGGGKRSGDKMMIK